MSISSASRQAFPLQHYESFRHTRSSVRRQHHPLAAAACSSSTTPDYRGRSHQGIIMSLYEPRQFPDYPQSTMMHDPHQEQDDNSLQQNRYPSPPHPMSENPYHPQAMDAAAALGLEDMSELQPKEEDDALSPGRSKPIPKPDREVTKGEDGRFVCTWVGCTEEVQRFNRKCEWSKVRTRPDTCGFGGRALFAGLLLTFVLCSSIWTSTIGLTNVLLTDAKSFLDLPIRADCCAINEKCTICTEDRANSSTVLTRTASDFQARDFRGKRI